jgi:phosphonoacetaldehyde hydrolase
MKLLNPVLPPNTIKADRLKAIVLDWAGTAVDFGSLAPARTMQKLFGQREIELSAAEARQHMGIAKKEHIRGILNIERVSNAWKQLHGKAPGDAEVDAIYAEFIPMQFSCLLEYADVIPGVVEAVGRFRERGLKIGSTTGYTREMLDMLLEPCARQGYSPDCSLTPGEVGSGRPHPFMMYECAIRLQVYPMSAIVKVGDTPADVLEGLNAGCWSVGVAGTGNSIGLSLAEFNALSAEAKEAALTAARAELKAAGAHSVIDSVAELDPVLDAIDELLKAGKE